MGTSAEELIAFIDVRMGTKHPTVIGKKLRERWPFYRVCELMNDGKHVGSVRLDYSLPGWLKYQLKRLRW